MDRRGGVHTVSIPGAGVGGRNGIPAAKLE